jgi:hypothetical protein
MEERVRVLFIRLICEAETEGEAVGGGQHCVVMRMEMREAANVCVKTMLGWTWLLPASLTVAPSCPASVELKLFRA